MSVQNDEGSDAWASRKSVVAGREEVVHGAIALQPLRSIPDICHGHTDSVHGEKICHVEKFQISVHDR